MSQIHLSGRAPVVFFEAMVLGQARQLEASRTGIYRCVLELLRALVEHHPDLLIVPFSRSPDQAADLALELKEQGLPVGLAPRQALVYRLLKVLLPERLARWHLRRIVHGLRRRIYDAVIEHAIPAAPGSPILQDTFLLTHLGRAGETCSRVAIAYDLIPILHSAWSQDGFFALFDSFYSSLRIQDSVICISEATRRDLLRCYTQLDPDRCPVVPLAASEHFRPVDDLVGLASLKSRIGLTADQPYFLSVCTLEPRKNLATVVQAFAQLPGLHDVHSNLRLVLTGTAGWGDQTRVIGLAKELGILDRLVITGFLSDEDLPLLYSSAVGFLYPSLYEGFGLPVLEAMQCGVPVITSDRSSLPEVAGDAGIMVDPLDPSAIAAAMAALLASANLQSSMQARSLALAARFSWQASAARVAELYRALSAAPSAVSSL